MGYFVDNKSRGNFLNSTRSGAPMTPEQFFNFPLNNFFPKFYEIIPAKVINVDYSNGSGKISADKIVVGDDGADIVEAFPINIYIKNLPIKGDTVLLIEYKLNLDKYQTVNAHSTSVDEIENLYSENKNSLYYYIGILNTKFNPSNYKNLYPLHGDTIYQGRYGQSIRFSSSISKNSVFHGNVLNPSVFGSKSIDAKIKDKLLLKNNWIYGDGHKDPLIIISTGRKLDPKESSSGIIEDINSDFSSIYMTSNSIIPLKIKQNESMFLSATPRSNNFSGAQLILVSDNIVFKSKKNTKLYSDQNIILNSSDAIVLTSGHDIVLEHAGLIYLGEDAAKKGEPVVKAITLIEILKKLITTLREDLVHKTPKATAELLTIYKDLNKIQSKKTYTL